MLQANFFGFFGTQLKQWQLIALFIRVSSIGEDLDLRFH